jgi:excisionase family DNA binding protein
VPSRVLAQNLRQEGRLEDAEVVDELAQNLEQQAERPQYATTGEVAKRLSVSRQTVVNWIKRGYLPGVQLGGRAASYT